MLETSEILFKFSIKNQTKAFGEDWEVGEGAFYRRNKPRHLGVNPSRHWYRRILRIGTHVSGIPAKVETSLKSRFNPIDALYKCVPIIGTH